MTQFWAHGFEGTSLDALEKSTGLNRSSLYSTFGGKLELFCRALDAYRDGPCEHMLRPLREQRGAAAIVGYFNGLRAFVRSRDAHRGCLMVNTKLAGAPDPAVSIRVQAHFRTLRRSVRTAYELGRADRTVNPALSPEEAADWVLTVARGILTGAASGLSTAALERSIDTTIRCLGPKG